MDDKRLVKDASVEGHALIFCKNIKITTRCWTTIDRRRLEPTKKSIPHIQGQRRNCRKGARNPWMSQTKSCVQPGPRGKKQCSPQRLSQTCLWGFQGLFQQLAAGTGTLAAIVLGGAGCWHKYLGCRGFDWAAWGPTTNKEGIQPHPLAENWIQDLLSRPCPSKQDSGFPIACPSHQEACTSLLSSFIRGQMVVFFGLILFETHPGSGCLFPFPG